MRPLIQMRRRRAWASVRKSLALALVPAMLLVQTAILAKAESRSSAAVIKGRVAAIGAGAQVAVRLTSGETVRGEIISFGGDSFTVGLETNRPDQVISYDQVTGIKKSKHRLPVILTAAAVAALVVFVALVIHQPPAKVQGR